MYIQNDYVLHNLRLAPVQKEQYFQLIFREWLWWMWPWPFSPPFSFQSPLSGTLSPFGEQICMLGNVFPLKGFFFSHSQILFRLRDPMICMLDHMCQWLLIHCSTYMSIKGGSGFVIGFQTVGGTMMLKWEECRHRWLLIIRNKKIL